MREIKFKGKRIDNGEWVEGDLTRYSKYMSYITVDLVEGEVYEVLTPTVGQYTGLHDKNSKEIYEGDIVHCWGGEYCQGYWEHDNKIPISNMINDCFMMGESENIEIIGNAYENPELLSPAK